jgi:nucleoside 2-deoxyribosyltransferase
MTDINEPSVYMAGSMGSGEGNDWRQGWRPHEVPDLNYGDDDFIGQKVTWAMIDFIYTGPFGDMMNNHSFLHGYDGAKNCGENVIFQRSLRGIDMADFVIAMVDSSDLSCHGTLNEIGYAYGRGKPVHLIVLHGPISDEVKEECSTSYDEIETQISRDGGTLPWFAEHMARRVYYRDRAEKSEAAWEALIRAVHDLAEEEEKARAREESNSNRLAAIKATMDEFAEIYRATLV